MTDSEVSAAASALLHDAIGAGRLPERPRPESLVRIAGIIRPVLAEKKIATASTSVAILTEVHGLDAHPEPV